MQLVSRNATFLAVLCVGGCAVGVADTPCDPLLGSVSPVELGSIKVAALDESAATPTRYVVDRDDGLHVFVEVDAVLHRRVVTGSGGGESASGELLTVNFDDAGTSRTLVVEFPANGPDRVALCPEDEERERLSVDEAVADGCTELQVIDEAEVLGMEVANLPAEVVEEYHAGLSTGEELVVLRPSQDWDYEDFRLFFGKPDALAEQAIVEVMRARDGGTTDIDFLLDGAAALAHFGVDGEWWVEIGGVQEELAPLTESLDQHAFTCL